MIPVKEKIADKCEILMLWIKKILKSNQMFGFYVIVAGDLGNTKNGNHGGDYD